MTKSRSRKRQVRFGPRTAHLGSGAHKQALGAFLREAERLGMSAKLAARLVDKSPQSIYAWRGGGRRMRRTSARVVLAATRVMQRYQGAERAALRRQLKDGELRREYRVLELRLEAELR